jgi:prepilin-type N-terminal cleavage/methylation domain-containing protein
MNISIALLHSEIRVPVMISGLMARTDNPEVLMTSATGIAKSHLQRKRGFTLVEILITFVLVGLISTFVIYSGANLHRLKNEPPLERVLMDAVREARYQAAITKEVSWLSYDAETGTFHIALESKAPIPAVPDLSSGTFGPSVITAKSDEEKKAIPASTVSHYKIFVPEDGDIPKVEFFAIPPGMGYDGDPEDDPEDIPLSRVPFDPGGFSVPFVVKVEAEDFGVRGRGSIRFDPFSNHILESEGLE